jgi:serine/threonine-protein kinase RsbW
MSDMSNDVIRLSFPANENYILAVRMVVSAVAERIGFNMDDIEDIKEVSAEGCNMLLLCSPETVNINMTIQKDALEMDMSAKAIKKSKYNPDGKLSEHLLEILVDECSITRRGKTVTGVYFKKCR